MALLKSPAPPALPYAPPQYNTRYGDEYSNILRLFFNQLSSVLSKLLGTFGGQYIDCPNGLLFDLGTYAPAAINTGYPLEFKIEYLNNGVHIVDDTKITVDVGGVYNFQYSSAVTSTNSSAKTVYVWIVRNGTPIGYSTNSYTVSGSGHSTIISWNFNIDIQAGDYIQLYWSSDNLNVEIGTTPPTPPHPGIPANVVAVNFISPLPATLPTPP